MTNSNEPAQMQAALLELVIRSARRCAHDLDHAASLLFMSQPPRELAEALHSRAQHWRQVFYPLNGPKDYRDRLNAEIDGLTARIKQLEALCDQHGIDCDKDIF